jgi:hypothetical protein
MFRRLRKLRLPALETDIYLSHCFYRLPIQQSRLGNPLDHGGPSSFYEQSLAAHE